MRPNTGREISSMRPPMRPTPKMLSVISFEPRATDEAGTPIEYGMIASFIPYKPGYGALSSGIPSVSAVAAQANNGYLSVVSAPFIYAEDAALITDPDVVWYIGRMGDSSVTPAILTVRLSYLRLDLLGEGETFLRRFNRDDGLGTSAPRQWGGTSAQRSLRRYGYR